LLWLQVSDLSFVVEAASFAADATAAFSFDFEDEKNLNLVFFGDAFALLLLAFVDSLRDFIGTDRFGSML
jgi:hypothetical protein